MADQRTPANPQRGFRSTSRSFPTNGRPTNARQPAARVSFHQPFVSNEWRNKRLNNPMPQSNSSFTTIYGRNLLAEFQHFVHQPCLVVTMEDLWDKFSPHFTADWFHIHFVTTLDSEELQPQLARLPEVNSVIGLGGGQALDIAKYVAWKRRLPLFQAPTAMTVNAAFGHRAAIRFDGNVRYVGWVVPEAVYVDYDVVAGAPLALNRSGVCDILCYHTAHGDWKLAHERGKTERKWPYDAGLVAEAQEVFQSVLTQIDEIASVTDQGIRTLMDAHCWGGAAFHNAGWNPRHIEGVEHFIFYALEYNTRKHFIHGQPVCLGIYIGSAMQDNRADEMLATIHRAGVDIRPEAMGVTWEDVATALRGLSQFVTQAGLWYTIANEFVVTDAFIEHVRCRIEETYGAWHPQ
jgi:glycerol dehydrogenase-like iron-containing ADH family enzyme